MKTDHQSTRTITDDQALEIAMRISESRALMYLLGTTIQKEPHGITDEPDEEEQDGIGGLIRLVGQGLSEAFKSATNGSSPENALRGDSRGVPDFSEGMGGLPPKSYLHGNARQTGGTGKGDATASSQRATKAAETTFAS